MTPEIETTPRPATDDAELAAQVKARVDRPAVAMTVCGVLLIVTAGGAAASLLWDAAFAFDDRELEAALVNAGFCGATIPYSVVILLGAARMRHMRRYGLAVAATVMVLPFVFVGVGLVGVWALAVLLRRDVRRQFVRLKRGRAPDVREDYDDFRGDPAAVARARVRLPATLLAVGAGVNIFVCQLLLVWGISLLAASLLGVDTPLPHSGDDDEGVGYTLLCVAAIGISSMSVIALGAGRMRHLQSYRWSLATAILGVCSVVLVYLSVFVAPFAIWALVVLLSPAVRDEFRRSIIMVTDDDA